MEFHLTTPQKCDMFTTIFQNLKVFTEHVNIQFTDEQIYIQGMDSSHVSIYELSLKSAWFDSYKCEKPVTLGINTNIFSRVLSSREKSQDMTFVYGEKNEDKLIIHFCNGKNDNDFDRHFEMPLVSITTDLLQIPEIEYQAEFTLSAEEMAILIKQLKMFGDTMDIECSEENIFISSNSDSLEKMSGEIKMSKLSSYSIEEGAKISISFSLIYMNNICMFHKIANEIEVSIREEYPMKIRYNIGEEASMNFYLAPKIKDDE